MTTLASEYEELLNYLEKNKKSTKPKSKLDLSRQKAQTNTKKLIEECSEQINSDIPQYSTNTSTKGFDVKRFESLMRAKLIDEHKRLQSYERPYISVSELCSCIRKSYYSRLRYPIDVKEQYRFAYLYLINQVGDRVHEIFQSIYDFSEVEKTVVSEHYRVKGRVDAIRERFLYELKTIDVEKFKGKYLREHYLQGLIYAHILNNEYNYNINIITIVYVLRNLKSIRPYDLQYDPKVAESLLQVALTLRSSIEKKIVPDPINSTEEQCRFCLYKKFCKEDECKNVNRATDSKKQKESEAVFLL